MESDGAPCIPPQAASEDEVSRLRASLERSEESRQKLRTTVRVLKEGVVNTGQLLTQHQLVLKQLEEEKGLRAKAEGALQMACEKADAAARVAGAAQGQAAQLARRLAAVEAQCAQLQMSVAGLQAAADAAPAASREAPPAAPAQRAQQQAEEGPTQAQLRLQEQLDEMEREMERWRFALAPLAALAGGQAPPLPPARKACKQQQPRQPRAAPAAAGKQRGTKPEQQQGRQQGQNKQQEQRQQQQQQQGQQGGEHADARARAVGELRAQQAAAAEGRAPPLKRQRPPPGPPAATDTLQHALEVISPKRARHDLPPQQGQQLQQQRQAARPQPPQPVDSSPPAAAPSPAAGPSPADPAEVSMGVSSPPAAASPPAAPSPAEPSLAVSANLQQGERAPEALPDAATRILARVAEAHPDGVTMPAVHAAAAELHHQLRRGLLPLPALLNVLEQKMLQCAADRPQLGSLRPPAGDGPGGSAAAGPGFTAVWGDPEALAGHRLQWLLHCTAEVHRLQREQPQVPGRAPGGGQGFAADALRGSLHALLLRECADRRAGRRDGGHTQTELCAAAAAAAALCRVAGELKVCQALLLDLALLGSQPEAGASAGEAAAAALPLLAAALEAWPQAAAAPAAAAADAAPVRAKQRQQQQLEWGSFHAALRHLSALAVDAAAAAAEAAAGGQGAAAPPTPGSPEAAAAAAAGAHAPGSPQQQQQEEEEPPLPSILVPLAQELQLPAPAAAALQWLGRQHWGWAEDGGDEAAAEEDAAAAAALCLPCWRDEGPG